LKEAGFTVDYYKGEEVTVEFYRNLPTHGYSLIVLRVHSALNAERRMLNIFTSEFYSKRRYIYEQLNDRVTAAAPLPYPAKKGDPVYFAITHKFVQSSMKGKFNHTLIIMMGCSGLKYDIAQAFLKKGAVAYIAWTQYVTAPQTDKATINVVRHLFSEKQTIEEAVTQSMKEMGQAPGYKSSLLFLPVDAGSYAVEDVDGKIKVTARKDRDQVAVSKLESTDVHGEAYSKSRDRIVELDRMVGKWKAVVLKVTDRDLDKAKEYTIGIKSEFVIPDSNLMVYVEDFLPDFYIAPTGVTALSNEPRNPATKVVISEDGKVVFRGWLFKLYPKIHPFEHSRYSIILKNHIARSYTPTNR